MEKETEQKQSKDMEKKSKTVKHTDQVLVEDCWKIRGEMYRKMTMVREWGMKREGNLICCFFGGEKKKNGNPEMRMQRDRWQ